MARTPEAGAELDEPTEPTEPAGPDTTESTGAAMSADPGADAAADEAAGTDRGAAAAAGPANAEDGAAAGQGGEPDATAGEAGAETTAAEDAEIETTDAQEWELELRPPLHRVARKALLWWTLQAAGCAVVLVGMESIVLGLLWGWNAVSVPIAVCTAAVALAYVLVMPPWRYRVHRWETTEDAVFTSAGWIWQQWRVAPLSRIQTVDAERGPVQRMLKLSTVTVTTASSAGPVKIAGLDHEVAERMVRHLTRTTQATRGDAT